MEKVPASANVDVVSEARLASVSGVGPLSRKRLVEAFGDAKAVLEASAGDLCRVRGIGSRTARAITEAPSANATTEMLNEARRRGIEAITIASERYPSRLRELYDPPPVLYVRGKLPAERAAVAIVGTRRATRYGLRAAEMISAELTRAGVTVVSGLARGIDAAAHRACLAEGGTTVAVLGGGLQRIYPPEHDRLADEVAENGALLAESPPPMPPMSGSFPQRNRIISGLSLGVVVIEAAERSGALITARHAAEQGREAFAVPGPVDSPQSRGCHRLIQEGAKLVIDVEDILEELSCVTPRIDGSLSRAESVVEHRIDPPTDPTELAIWNALGDEPAAIDEIIEKTGLPAPRVLACVAVMEAAGRIKRISGAIIARG